MEVLQEQYYDTTLFIEILESQMGINFMRQDIKEDVILRWYHGMKGNAVMIDCSYEDITFTSGRFYLIQLGLVDLIPALFPVSEESWEEALLLPGPDIEKEIKNALPEPTPIKEEEDQPGE